MQNSEETIWLAESIFKMTWGYNSISGNKEGKDASKEKKKDN